MVESEHELLTLAAALSGQSLGELAASINVPAPQNALRAKGWVGELLEILLGTTAGNRAVPDFEALGVELKTLPLTSKLLPKESTFVCSAALNKPDIGEFEQSTVYKKLRKVLWIPFEADTTVEITLRRIGVPFLWQPSGQDLALLKRDWEEHMETISLGQIDQIDGRRGKYLQLRPKAFSSHNRTQTFDAEGNRLLSNPRGFYLRSSFTKKILQENTP